MQVETQAAVMGAEDFTQQTEFVGRKERLSFYFAALFRDTSYAMMSMVNYFYTDILGLRGVKLGALLWVEKLWDGINDPLVGAYFDKRPYQGEKARVFFKTTAVPFALLLVAMFLPIRFSANDNLNTWLRMGFVMLCYIPFEALHSLSGTSFMSYYNSITPNIQERGKVISHSRLFSTCGNAGIAGGIPILLGLVPKEDVRSKTMIYLATAVFVAICFMVFNALMYTQVKERIATPTQEGQTISGIIRSMFQNKLLLLMIASSTISGLISAGNTGMYFYDYNIGNTIWLPVIGIAGFPSLMLASWLTPKLAEKAEKRNLVILCAIARVLCNLLYLAVGYQSKIFMAFMTFLTEIPNSIKGMLYWSMIADSVDYGEWKTGKRNDGIIYAAEGLMSKIVGAFGATSTAIIIWAIKFEPNAPSQTAATLRGLFVVPKAIEVVSILAALIPYIFYRFTRKDHARVIEELVQRNTQAAAP